MKRLKSFILVIVFFSGVNLVLAQKQKPPAGGKPKDFKLTEKKSKTLPNGLRTSMVQYGAIPKVSIAFTIKTGNVHEKANEIWLAELTGRMLKQGTTHLSFKELSKKVAGMGGEVNVYVGMDQTTISGTVLSEYAPEFIKIVGDMVTNPAFPATELSRLKADLKRQLSVQKSVPQSLAEEKLYQAVYKDHPYGRYFPTEKMIDSYSLQMVKDFYTNNFGGKRSVLYVVGKYDEAAVNAAVQDALGKWKAGPPVMYPPVALRGKRDTIIVDRKSAPQTTVMIGLPALTPNDKDYVGQIVTNSLLGGSFGSRITSNIRENKGYTYSPYSYVLNRQGTSLWIEQADVTSEHTVAALREIEKEIKRLQSEPPSKEELEGIKNYEAGIFVLQNSSNDGIISQLNFLDRYGLPDSYLVDLVKNIYKISPEMVSEIAKKHFKDEDLTLIMVGDKKTITSQLETQKKAKKEF